MTSDKASSTPGLPTSTTRPRALTGGSTPRTTSTAPFTSTSSRRFGGAIGGDPPRVATRRVASSGGLGGSAASAAAAVIAADALLESHAPIETLIACALEGERLGAGSAHPDNVAPALCGGFVLVRHPNPPDIIRLPVPAGLTAVVVHPDLEIETAGGGGGRRASRPLGHARPSG